MQRYCFFLIYANNFEKKCVFWENSGVFVVLGGIDAIDVIDGIDDIDGIDGIDDIDGIVAIDAIDAIGILAGGDACAPGQFTPPPTPSPQAGRGSFAVYPKFSLPFSSF